MKTLNRLQRQNGERFSAPRSVQDVIPVQRIWEDGIFEVGAAKKKPGIIMRIVMLFLRLFGIKGAAATSSFSKTFRFEDINYSVASKEDKEAMFLQYSELLNAFDSSASYKITIIVKKLDKDEFKKSILIPLKGDDLDYYRKEYNKILLDEATGANGFIQQKYITVTVNKKGIDEARNYFARVVTDLTAHFNRLGSRAIVLDAGDRLRILHDFFRPDEESGFHFDMRDNMRKGHNSRLSPTLCVGERK